MANRYNYYDLDPTYRNAFGQPLMRMTFDYKDNEHKMSRHIAQVINELAKSMNPTSMNPAAARTDVVVGGAVSKHAQYRRHDHGHQPGQQRGQQVSAKLGLPQSLHHGRERVPAQLGLQPDRPGRRAGLPRGGYLEKRLSQETRPAGVGMNIVSRHKLPLLVLTGLFAAAGAHADGDAARGKKLFEECAACHSLERGVNGVGPGLQGVFERKAGDLADYRYSPAMKRSGLAWSARTLDIFIADPQKEILGNRMPFSGMPEARDRADLIEYLRGAAR